VTVISVKLLMLVVTSVTIILKVLAVTFVQYKDTLERTLILFLQSRGTTYVR